MPHSIQSTYPMQTWAKSRIVKSNPKCYLSTALILSLIPTEPTSYTQAVKSPEWRTAMAEEFTALHQQGTWTLVPT